MPFDKYNCGVCYSEISYSFNATIACWNAFSKDKPKPIEEYNCEAKTMAAWSPIVLFIPIDASILSTIFSDKIDEKQLFNTTNLRLSIDGSKELKAYKLDIENVLTTYYVHMGNGGFGYFVFVKEDGKISYLSYSELINNGKIELKVINNLNNVVSVIENIYSMKPYVITSDGRELLLSDYIN